MRSPLLLLALMLATSSCAQGRDVAVPNPPPTPDAGPPCATDCSTIETPPCVHAVCDEVAGQCKVVPVAADTPCDDGLFCTVGERCSEGVCSGGQPNPCGASDCSDGICNEAEDTCTVLPRSNGTPCAAPPADLCEVGAECRAGQCVGIPKDCAFAPGVDECKVGLCNPSTGACEVGPANDGAPCLQDVCATYQTCFAGACQGGLIHAQGMSSNDPAACVYNECVADGPAFNYAKKTVAIGDECPISGYAGYECATGTCAAGGVCQRVAMLGASCVSATDECSVGACNEEGTCEPYPAHEGATCDDRSLCTKGDTCAAGTCSGKPDDGVAIYFSDTFGEGNKGWTGPQATKWTIRAGAPLDAGIVGLGVEPTVDHTASMDNLFLSSEGCDEKDYIETPTIDLSQAAGQVWLTLSRAVSNPIQYQPYVQVFDGAQWQTVWTQAALEFVREYTWHPVVADVTSFKNASFKVRIGVFSIATIFEGGGGGCWHVDDVTVASRACAVP